MPIPRPSDWFETRCSFEHTSVKTPQRPWKANGDKLAHNSAHPRRLRTPTVAPGSQKSPATQKPTKTSIDPPSTHPSIDQEPQDTPAPSETSPPDTPAPTKTSSPNSPTPTESSTPNEPTPTETQQVAVTKSDLHVVWAPPGG